MFCLMYYINNMCDVDLYIVCVLFKLKFLFIVDDVGNIFVNVFAMCFVVEVCKNVYIWVYMSRKFGGGGVFEFDFCVLLIVIVRGVCNGVGFGVGFGVMGDSTMSREISAWIRFVKCLWMVYVNFLC